MELKMAFQAKNTGNGAATQAPANPLAGLTNEQLIAMIQQLQATGGASRKPTFSKSKKDGSNVWTFTHQSGAKGVFPWVNADASVWRLIVANVEMIKTALDAAKA
jgi:hypothetical protein